MKGNPIIGYSLAMAVAFSVSTSQAQTSNQQASGLNTADQHFLNEAVEGDLSEINMGKLPPTEGREQKVKQFGQMQEQRYSQHLEKTQDYRSTAEGNSASQKQTFVTTARKSIRVAKRGELSSLNSCSAVLTFIARRKPCRTNAGQPEQPPSYAL